MPLSHSEPVAAPVSVPAGLTFGPDSGRYSLTCAVKSIVDTNLADSGDFD